MRTAGIILIAAGVILALYTGFSYLPASDEVTEGLATTAPEEPRMTWQPFAGLGLAVAGVLLLISDAKARKYSY